MEYIKAYTASNTIILALKSRLNENKIRYIIQDNFTSSIHAGFGEQPNNIELLIHKDDAEIAKPILLAFDKEVNG